MNLDEEIKKYGIQKFRRADIYLYSRSALSLIEEINKLLIGYGINDFQLNLITEGGCYGDSPSADLVGTIDNISKTDKEIKEEIKIKKRWEKEELAWRKKQYNELRKEFDGKEET